MKKLFLASLLYTGITIPAVTNAGTPTVHSDWVDVSGLSHSVCMSYAEKAVRGIPNPSEFTKSKVSVFQDSGNSIVAVRCGNLGNGKGRFAFIYSAGSNASNLITKVKNNFKAQMR